MTARDVLVVAGLGLGVVLLADATQNRPDPTTQGTTTTIEFTVATRDLDRGGAAAAASLWTVCANTVGGDTTSPRPQGDGWVVTVSPAIGPHGENRLVGCLEDLTIDRVAGDVTSVRTSR